MPLASDLDTIHASPIFAVAGCALSFIRRVSASTGLPYDVIKQSFDKLPVHALPMLDSPAGWTVLAAVIGISFSPTVH